MSASILRLIDHAVLQPTQTADDLRAACQLCREVETATVCVKPCDVALAGELLTGSQVLVSTVIGFPHGGTSTYAKTAEAARACEEGARELDMVINLGWACAGEIDRVEAEIKAIADVARSHNAMIKVILETGLLATDELKQSLCRAAENAGAAFVKTSTGFGMIKNSAGQLTATGATEHDIRLMRSCCGPTIGVKASGGIRSLADAVRMLAAGATRLGTSATAVIACELSEEARLEPSDRPLRPSLNEY